MDQRLPDPAVAAPPDWRELCEELFEALDGWHKAVFETGTSWVRPDETYLLDRARTALAQPEPEVVGPSDGQAVPVGREPASVVGEPSDEELLRTYGLAKRDYQYEGPIDDWPKRAERAATVAGLRAVLARWGNYPVKPDSSAPAPAGERQAAPLPLLPEDAQVIEPSEHTLLVPVPVPVAVRERLPQPEDCDAVGRCWVHQPHEACPESPAWELMLAKYASANYGAVCWLPAHALPLPSGEVGS